MRGEALETVTAAALAPAEAAQASTGGGNPRLAAALGGTTADGESLATSAVASCLLVTDRPAVADAVTAALGARGVAVRTLDAGDVEHSFDGTAAALAGAATDGPVDAVVVALRSTPVAADLGPGWERTLAEHAIAHHFPACRQADQPVLALLGEVTERTARLIAQWQAVGFCHGVMNTDNMSLLGLTIDYGPFGFLDVFDPQHICNHSDEGGLYAYARQPKVGWWNLHAFAQALVPLVGQGQGTPEDVAAIRAALARYETVFAQALAAQMRAKLGLREVREGDQDLVNDWLRLLETQKVDYTIAMRRLCDFSPRDAGPVRDVFMDREAFDVWAMRYAERLSAEHSTDTERQAAMRRANPRVVLRNHLAETAIQRAEQGDFSEVQRLLAVLSHPFDDDSGTAADAGFPPDWAQQLSVSCSS